MNATNWRNNVSLQERTLLWQQLLAMLNKFPTTSNEAQVMNLAKNFEEKVWNRANTKEEYTKLMVAKIKRIADELAKQNIDRTNVLPSQTSQPATQNPSANLANPLPTLTNGPPANLQPPALQDNQIISTPSLSQLPLPTSKSIISTHSTVSNHSLSHPDSNSAGNPSFPLTSFPPQLSTQTKAQTQPFPSFQAQSQPQSQPLIQQQPQQLQQKQQTASQQQASAMGNQVPAVQYPYNAQAHRLQSHEPGFQALQARAALAQQQQQYLIQQQLLQRQLQSSSQPSASNFAHLSPSMPLQQGTPSPSSYYQLVSDPTSLSSLSSTNSNTVNPTTVTLSNVYPIASSLPTNPLMVFRNSQPVPAPPTTTTTQVTSLMTPLLTSGSDPSLHPTMQIPSSNLHASQATSLSAPPFLSTAPIHSDSIPTPPLPTKKQKTTKTLKSKLVSSEATLPSSSLPSLPPPSSTPTPVDFIPVSSLSPSPVPTVLAIHPSTTSSPQLPIIPPQTVTHLDSFSPTLSVPNEPEPSPPSSQATLPALSKRSGPPSILSSRIQYSEKPLAPEDMSKMGKKTQEAFTVYQEFNKILLKLASTSMITEAMRKAAHQKREATYARLRRHFELMQQKKVLMNFEQLSSFIAEMQKTTVGISTMLRRYEATQLSKASLNPMNKPEADSSVPFTSPPSTSPIVSNLPLPTSTLPDTPLPPSVSTSKDTASSTFSSTDSTQSQTQTTTLPIKVIKPSILHHRLPKLLREQREKELSRLAQSSSTKSKPLNPSALSPVLPLPTSVSPSSTTHLSSTLSPPPPVPAIDTTVSGLANFICQWEYLENHVDGSVQSVLLSKCFGSQKDWFNAPDWIQWAIVHELETPVENDGQEIEQLEFQYGMALVLVFF
ncbi:hypothetical protein HMI54_015676 [Coelomomyces lativittatus]|nr:hypothetical protein HMI54_015676 [Coelomomyces lativittatus]